PKSRPPRGRRLEGIDHIGRVGLHIEERIPEIGSQSDVVGRNHSIPKLDIHGEKRPLIHISHERGGAPAGCTGKTVGPGYDWPTPGGWWFVGNENHARCGHVLSVRRARVIEN